MRATVLDPVAANETTRVHQPFSALRPLRGRSPCVRSYRRCRDAQQGDDFPNLLECRMNRTPLARRTQIINCLVEE
jgi:hypothetical protein